MTTTVDVNVLLYASDASSARQQRALEVVEELARGPSLVYLFWPTIIGYLRIATHPAIFERPLNQADAEANVDRFLARPHVHCPGEPETFWDTYRDVSLDARPAGNLVSDAQLVALMQAHGVRRIWTHDRDFRRFTGIEML